MTDEPRKVTLMCPITVWAHPMTDGRTYLCRKGEWGSYTAISEGDHDLAYVGRETGRFFDFALGPDGEIGAVTAQRIEARSDETPAEAVQPERQEPGPKDAPKNPLLWRLDHE